MKSFSQSAFDSFILKNRVVGFFDHPVTLKSGRKTHWYVNWRDIAGDVFLLDKASDFVLAFAEKLFAEGVLPGEDLCFYGVPEGATKLGVLTQYKWAKSSTEYEPGSHILSMGRAMPKAHGLPRDKFFVGAPQGKVVVLEDVTTTGGSLVKTIERLQSMEISVSAAFGLTNRMQRTSSGKSVQEVIADRNVPYYQLSRADVLLPRAIKLLGPSQPIIDSIVQEFRRDGVEIDL